MSRITDDSRSVPAALIDRPGAAAARPSMITTRAPEAIEARGERKTGSAVPARRCRMSDVASNAVVSQDAQPSA